MAAGATRHGVLKLGVEPDDARVHGARHMQAWPRSWIGLGFFLFGDIEYSCQWLAGWVFMEMCVEPILKRKKTEASC
jgi:hypothetical protein